MARITAGALAAALTLPLLARGYALLRDWTTPDRPAIRRTPPAVLRPGGTAP